MKDKFVDKNKMFKIVIVFLIFNSLLAIALFNFSSWFDILSGFSGILGLIMVPFLVLMLVAPVIVSTVGFVLAFILLVKVKKYDMKTRILGVALLTVSLWLLVGIGKLLGNIFSVF